MSHPSERLARWSSGFAPDDVPGAVRAVARNCLIDTLGVALAGATSAVARTAQRVAGDSFALGPAVVPGTRMRLAPPGAAFANATAAHALDFDDNCYAGVVHGSAIIVPAALALAQAVDSSGAQLIDAIIAGSEAEYAFGAAATMHLYEKGWWTTAVLGPVGASVAAARLLGLDASATTSAIGLALAGAGGAKAAFGTDAKPLLAGRAAEAGVMAARLAMEGASGPSDIAGHPRGFAALLNDGVFDAGAFDGFGVRWRLLDPGIDIKRIPVCLSAHTSVDVVAGLVRTHAIAPAEIARIVCDVPPVILANLIHDRPATRQQAQFSMPFAIAATLVLGDVTLTALAREAFRDPAVHALMEKVEMASGPYWDEAARRAAPEGARVRMHLTDGRALEGFRAYPRGAASDPLGDGELAAKFDDCARLLLTPEAAGELYERLRHIETRASVRDLLDGLDAAA
ncbi:MmgE/PrpD family protein [Ancylobacter pratisalsi]|uniref:MmgE/PrpD family protein n=1 Tax=Ancylobacter pratisalsi TaxID=1745854 RepID=A0A6P1YNH8_9HYPH|nr:MmgE/PrpD family protein [Ancylobacter pratisalsi]QIB34256.1 MmgE/PrpD family protein [Ancylobacter pratisalsi]